MKKLWSQIDWITTGLVIYVGHYAIMGYQILRTIYDVEIHYIIIITNNGLFAKCIKYLNTSLNIWNPIFAIEWRDVTKVIVSKILHTLTHFGRTQQRAVTKSRTLDQEMSKGDATFKESPSTAWQMYQSHWIQGTFTPHAITCSSTP